MPRTSGVELPSEQELHTILQKESPRLAVRYDYGVKHPNLFDAYKSIAQAASIDTTWIDYFAEMPLSETKQRADAATEQMIHHICTVRNDYDALFNQLCIDDTPRSPDVIFVFGSPSDARITHAVKLFNNKLSDKIIVSGRGPHYGVNDVSEAARMAKVAHSSGVPVKSIIEESLSITMPDNVKRAIDMLVTMNWQPQSIVAVASSFTQRRAQMEWYKFLPWEANIQVVSPPAHQLPLHIRSSTWVESRKGVALLMNEYNKLIVEQAMDLFRVGKVQ